MLYHVDLTNLTTIPHRTLQPATCEYRFVVETKMFWREEGGRGGLDDGKAFT